MIGSGHADRAGGDGCTGGGWEGVKVIVTHICGSYEKQLNHTHIQLFVYLEKPFSPYFCGRLAGRTFDNFIGLDIFQD